MRAAGTGHTAFPTLVLLHGGPGSSAGLEPLIAALADERRTLAPDTMGCGDSDAPGHDDPDIAHYAADLQLLLGELDVGTVDIYGHHRGAQIACEFAIAHPQRVRRLVLDGVGLFSKQLRTELLDRYAPPLLPDEDGHHLSRVWNFASQLTRRFPHYSCDPAHRIVPEIVLPPAATTDIAAEILKNWSTFHLGYRAAFRHDMAARLPFVEAATLILKTVGDPLTRYAEDAAAVLPNGSTMRTTKIGRADVIRRFLSVS